MIRFIRPSLPSPETWIPFLRTAYHERHFSNFGPVHDRFEEELTTEYCRSGRRAVLASSATSALTACLMAMGVRGQVIIPSFTFPATLQAVRQAGCEPVILDVEEDTWELSPARVVQALDARERVGAIVPVRAFGLCRDMDVWSDVGRHFEVPIVIDAAAALGGRLGAGIPVGNQGTVEVFSMHATKVFGIGEGGVAFVPEDLVEPFRRAINFGLPADAGLSPGFNGKLSEFHSAIGLAMLVQIDGAVARRNEIANAYREYLSDLEGLSFPDATGSPPWQAFPVLLPPSIRSDDVVRVAANNGLELRGYYRPALHDAYSPDGSDHPYGDCPTSEYLSHHVICLPVYSDMSTREVSAVLRRTEMAVRTAGGRR